MKPIIVVILAVVFVVIVITVIVAVFPFANFLRRPSGSIFVSEDVGEHWFAMEESDESTALSRANILSLEYHPEEAELVYAGTEKKGLWRSTDGGNVWQQVFDHNEVLSPTASVYSIAPGPVLIDEEEGIREHLYVGVFQNGFGRILKTDDGGTTFTEVYVTTGEAGVFFITIDPARPNVVWAGTGEGLLLRSLDEGETWEKIHEFRGTPSGIVLHAARPNELLMTTFDRGIERSQDGGRTFVNLSDALKPFRHSEDIFSIEQDSYSPSVLYLGTEFGLLRSENAGLTWFPVNLVIPQAELPILDVEVSPVNSNQLLVAADGNIYISQDRGRTWRVEHRSGDRLVHDITVSREGKVVIGTHKE